MSGYIRENQKKYNIYLHNNHMLGATSEDIQVIIEAEVVSKIVHIAE